MRERAVPVVPVVRAGSVRAGPGNHVDVAARWLQQRDCHIDVAGAAAGAGPVEAGGAGAPDEVPAAGACDAISPVAGLFLPKSRTRATFMSLSEVEAGDRWDQCGS